MRIVIETIPHKEQRYDTCGDWWREGDTLHVRVSRMDDPRHEHLVAVHELVEAILCENDGVKAQKVDDFDFKYSGLGEPGDDALAPYQAQHCFATSVERMLCAAMGVKWANYENEVANLE